MNLKNGGDHPVTSQPRATSSLIEVQYADTSVQSVELRRLLSSDSIKLRHKRRFGSWCNDEYEIFSGGMDIPCLSALQTSLRNPAIFCCASQEIHVFPVTYQNQVGASVTPCLTVSEQDSFLSNALQKVQMAMVQFPPGEKFGTITYKASDWFGNSSEYVAMNSQGSTRLKLEKKSNALQIFSNKNIQIEKSCSKENGVWGVTLTWIRKDLEFQDKILSFGFLLYFLLKSKWLPNLPIVVSEVSLESMKTDLNTVRKRHNKQD